MPKTIEVEIDAAGHLRALEPITLGRPVRALLVLPDEALLASSHSNSTAAAALEMLASPRYSKRRRSDPYEVRLRIAALRSDWNARD